MTLKVVYLHNKDPLNLNQNRIVIILFNLLSDFNMSGSCFNGNKKDFHTGSA